MSPAQGVQGEQGPVSSRGMGGGGGASSTDAASMVHGRIAHGSSPFGVKTRMPVVKALVNRCLLSVVGRPTPSKMASTCRGGAGLGAEFTVFFFH